MKIVIASLLLLLIIGCDEHFNENELYGYYVPVGYGYTFDTIQLKANSVYYRKVYDRNNKIVLEMNGKWTLERKCIIHFEPFFLNLDNDLARFPEMVKDTTGGWQGYTETKQGSIQFCVGYFAKTDTNCYRKIK